MFTCVARKSIYVLCKCNAESVISFVGMMSWHPFYYNWRQFKTSAHTHNTNTLRVKYYIRTQSSLHMSCYYTCNTIQVLHSQMSFYPNNNTCEKYTHNWYWYCSIKPIFFLYFIRLFLCLTFHLLLLLFSSIVKSFAWRAQVNCLCLVSFSSVV